MVLKVALFCCFVRGENFPGRLIGEAQPVGFYTTRFVEAESAEEAKAVAVGLLRQDPSLALPGECSTKDSKVYVEEIVEVPPETERMPNRGFTFFIMGT